LKAILARHGLAGVNGNRQGAPYIVDRFSSLTPEGARQAQKLGRFAREAFPWVASGDYNGFTSRYYRTHQTFIAAGFHGVPIALPQLNEHNWGIYMERDPEIGRRYPDETPEERALRRESLRPAFDANYKIRIGLPAPEGESSLDVYLRVKEALITIYEEYADSNIVIVLHGRTGIAARMFLEGIPPTDEGWQYTWSHLTELANCGMLYYPDFNPADTNPAVSGKKVAVINPPYCKPEEIPWQSYLGAGYLVRPTITLEPVLHAAFS
jgi:broad specificity phosphatase PhoE